MYKAHFGLRELPFGITPDTSFFFACSNYQAALNTLLIATKNGEGFIKITGEVGTGKTLLCRKFMATLDASIVNAALPTIQGGIAASADEGTWISTSYLVAEIVMIPLAGWFEKIFGLRNFLLLATSLFIDSASKPCSKRAPNRS